MKNLNKRTIVKTIKITLVIFISIMLFTVSYSLIFEQDKIFIDKYNFQQLEKVKNTLNNFQNFKSHFENLKDLNNKYNLDIKPIKNCYYTQSHNGNYLYIFGFKLESLLYKLRYFNWYYVYPKYDLPYSMICDGGETCYDGKFTHFRYVISNPCED